MDWLQKALDKSKESDTANFEFKTSSSMKNTYSSENTSGQAETRIAVREITPPNPLNEKLILTKQSDTHSVTAYNFLSAKTLSMMKGKNSNTLAITSPTSRAGTTLTAANLATSISRSLHDTVVLVELDLRKPVFYHYFGLENREKGLSDHLIDNAELKDTLIKMSGTDLVLLTAGTTLEQHPNILASPQIRQFVRDISALYSDHLIIFDLPALLDTDDALPFLQNVGASLLVVEEGINTSEHINQCTDILKNHGLLGAVLNKSKSIS
ncbi:MAG: CpsD/CapB family tyrosine-protein kinase [Methylococcales bacterium]